jgi:hypothetical protein
MMNEPYICKMCQKQGLHREIPDNTAWIRHMQSHHGVSMSLEQLVSAQKAIDAREARLRAKAELVDA